MGDPTEPLWAVPEAAAFLRMTVGAVYAAVERGQIPCVRLGRRLRFRPAEIRAWVEGGERGCGAA